MGGYGHLNKIDIRDSKEFIEKIKQIHNSDYHKILELGAGIGRISKELFIHYF